MPTDDFTESTKDYCVYKAWSVCHNFKTEHQGDLRRTLVNKWVEAVAGFDETTCQRIAAMLNFAQTSYQIDVFDEAIQTLEDVCSVLHSNIVDH